LCNKFQTDNNIRAALLTINTAGGTHLSLTGFLRHASSGVGLTFTAAAHVLFAGKPHMLLNFSYTA